MNTDQIDRELAEIREINERAHADEAARRASLGDADRAREQADTDRAATIKALQLSLARDLGVDAEVVPEILNAKHAAAIGSTKLIYGPLFRLWHSLRPTSSGAGPKADPAREARHALAAMGQLPPVRSSDKAFLADAQVRAAVPKFEPESRTPSGRDLISRIVGLAGVERPLVEVFGIPVLRELAPAVESPEAARRRLGPAPIVGAMFGGSDNEPKWDRRGRPIRGVYIRPDRAQDISKIDPRELHRRELELVGKRWDLARRERRAEYLRALVVQRTAIVAAIDRALADLLMGEGWFWARHLRRIAALESPVSIADDVFDLAISKIHSLACAGGARFNLSHSK